MSLLSNQIWQCLDLDLLDGAEVLAEQLVAHENNADAQYLLARVLLRRGQPESVRRLTHQPARSHLGCAWAYARACLDLRDYNDGIACLLRVRSKWALDHDLALSVAYTRGELTAAAFHLLLAKLYDETQPEKAVKEYKASAKLNPYLWENVFKLCQSRVTAVRGARMFSRFPDPFKVSSALHSHSLANETPSMDSEPFASQQMRVSVPPRADVRSTPRSEANRPELSAERTFSYANRRSEFNTESNLPIAAAAAPFSPVEDLPVVSTALHASTPRRIVTPQRALTTPMTFNARTTPFHPPPAARPAPLRESYASFRRSDQSTLPSLGRGFFEAPNHTPNVNLSSSSTQIGLTPLVSHFQALPSNLNASTGTGVSSLEILVDALDQLSQCEFAAALASLAALAADPRRAPFVKALEAQLYLELGQHEQCVAAFTDLRRRQPDRVRGMELLSTAMWHLRQVQPLALLGFELTNRGSFGRRAWTSWCVLGNAFSAQHDVPNAIKCFQRSLTLQPTAVAYTLLGYELMLNEELQEAVHSFSQAIRCAPHHYNAWYGLSSACYSLGALEAAESHCAQALRINRSNPVLHCFMGTLLAERGALMPAIDAYDCAIALDPQSAVPQFRKVEALVQLGRPEEALAQLLEVEKLAPEDPHVQLELATLFRQLHQGERAVQHYTMAQQLAPKTAPKVRRYLLQL